MRLYLSGAMSGIDQGNVPAFAAAAMRLRAAGYEVVSPHELDGEIDFDNIGEDGPLWWARCLVRDLAVIRNWAEGVAVLPGWEASRGAQLEVEQARVLEHPIRTVQGWVNQP